MTLLQPALRADAISQIIVTCKQRLSCHGTATMYSMEWISQTLDVFKQLTPLWHGYMTVLDQWPGGGDGPAPPAEGVEALIEELVKLVPAQPRPVKGPFLFSVDHCFAVKGQGTVLTGTVLAGSVEVCHPQALTEACVVTFRIRLHSKSCISSPLLLPSANSF